MNSLKLHQNQDKAKGSSKSPLTPQLHQLLLCLLMTGYQNYNPMHSLDLWRISNNLFCQVLSISRKKKWKNYCACKYCIKWVISVTLKANWTTRYQSNFLLQYSIWVLNLNCFFSSSISSLLLFRLPSKSTYFNY